MNIEEIFISSSYEILKVNRKHNLYYEHSKYLVIEKGRDPKYRVTQIEGEKYHRDDSKIFKEVKTIL